MFWVFGVLASSTVLFYLITELQEKVNGAVDSFDDYDPSNTMPIDYPNFSTTGKMNFWVNRMSVKSWVILLGSVYVIGKIKK